MNAVCEGFGCLPLAAREELEADPDRMAVRILERRAYARTKAAIDAATEPGQVPKGPMADQVLEIQAQILRERRAARGEDGHD